MLAFFVRGFPCGNNTKFFTIVPSLTMDDDQNTKLIAYAKENIPLFISGIVVIELNCTFVGEDGLGFPKGNPMLPHVGLRFVLIPTEPEHTYIVCTRGDVSRAS